MAPSPVRRGWEFRAKSQIWRIFPSDSGFILGEDRDTAKKLVSFFCVRASDGTVVWRDLNLPEPWWVSIEAVSGQLLLLHEYRVPSMPDHQKILAVNIMTGTPVWTNEDLTFSFSTGESLYASQDLFDRRVFYQLDPSSGEILREVDGGTVHALRDENPENVSIPFAVPSPGGDIPDSARRHLGGADLHGPAEFLDHGRLSIFSCYEHTDAGIQPGLLREHLFIVDPEGEKICFHDVICDDVVHPSPAVFFRFGKTVLYIKEKKLLCSLNLL